MESKYGFNFSIYNNFNVHICKLCTKNYKKKETYNN